MAEVAGLAIGVVGLFPVVVEIVKSMRTIRSGIKTAKKCIKELDGIEIDLDVQHMRFHDACAFLLTQCGADKRTADDMVGNPNHDRWRDTTWDHQLQRVLGQTYDLYQRFIQAIRDKEKELESDLRCFDEARGQRMKVSFMASHVVEAIHKVDCRVNP
jgi:hypothetical protein